MSEVIGKEVLDKISIDDNVVRQVTTAKDVIGDSKSTGLIESVTETPTELASGATNPISIGIILVAVVVIYFLFRSK